MWYVCLLRQHVLYLTNTLLIQQAVLISKRQAQWLSHWFEVAWNRNQARMTCVCSINTTDAALLLSMRLQDCLSSSPAESNSANLVGARDLAHSVDKA